MSGGLGEKLTSLVAPSKATPRCQPLLGTEQGTNKGEERGTVRKCQRDSVRMLCFLLSQVEFVAELPKTITGKIKRSELRSKEFGQM